MANPLVPCPACDRHVRASEARCPFCDSALPGDLAARAVPGLTERVPRAALWLFGATLAVTGCGGNESNQGGTQGGGTTVETSGGSTTPASDASSAGATDQSADASMPALVAMYGAAPPPPAETMSADAGGPSPSGSFVALYGAPMPPPQSAVDAGADAATTDAGRRPRRR